MTLPDPFPAPPAPAPRPSWIGALLVATAGTVALDLLASGAVLGVRAFARAHGGPTRLTGAPYLLLEEAFSCVAIVLALGLLARFAWRRIPDRYGLRPVALSAPAFVLAAVGMLALTTETTALSAALLRTHVLPAMPTPPEWVARAHWLHHAGVGMRLALTLAMGVFPAVGEELMFRGQLQRALLAHGPPVAAILVSSAVFAAFHVEPERLLGAFAFGCWVGWIAWRCDSIVPGMVLHALHNIALGALVALGAFGGGGFLRLSTLSGPALLEIAFAGLVVMAACAHLLARLLPAPVPRRTTVAATAAVPGPAAS